MADIIPFANLHLWDVSFLSLIFSIQTVVSCQVVLNHIFPYWSFAFSFDTWFCFVCLLFFFVSGFLSLKVWCAGKHISISQGPCGILMSGIYDYCQMVLNIRFFLFDLNFEVVTHKYHQSIFFLSSQYFKRLNSVPSWFTHCEERHEAQLELIKWFKKLQISACNKS